MIRVLILLLLAGGVIGCDETVLHGVDEGRANQIALLLERAGIQSSKHASGSNWNVRVDRTDLGAALRAIENSRILTRAESRYKAQDSSLIPSDNQQMQAAERQLSWSIEETLERIPGVVEAKVHIWLNKPAQFGLAPQEASARSASALLLTEPAADLNVNELKLLLSGATGAPVGSISIVAHRTDTRAVSRVVQPPSASSGLVVSKLSVWGLGGIGLTVATLWTVRRFRRKARPKLSPAHISKAGSPLSPAFNSENNVSFQ